MSESITVASLQFSAGQDIAENIERMGRWVAEAVAMEARWLVLPETWSLRVSADKHNYRYQQSVAFEAQLKEQMAQWAKQHQVVLFGGSIYTQGESEGKLRNTSFVYSDQGKLVGEYSKLHLFDLPAAKRFESEHVEAGSDLCVVEVDGWKVGLSICYDIRFPALFSKLRAYGAEVIVVPAAFTVPTGKAHWELLVRSRAVESQCYFIAVDQWGASGPGTECWGHSMTVDPWGDVCAQKERDDGIVLAELKKKKIETTRARMPLQEHALSMKNRNFRSPVES